MISVHFPNVGTKVYIGQGDLRCRSKSEGLRMQLKFGDLLKSFGAPGHRVEAAPVMSSNVPRSS
jgi:hypothetical protein